MCSTFCRILLATEAANLAGYLAHERARFGTSRDAITGLPLDATKHLVNVGLRGNQGGGGGGNELAGMRSAEDVADLARHLADPAHRDRRVLCIMTAGAGTGKTNFARQLMHAACGGGPSTGGRGWLGR